MAVSFDYSRAVRRLKADVERQASKHRAPAPRRRRPFRLWRQSWRRPALYLAFTALGAAALAWSPSSPPKATRMLLGAVAIDGDTFRMGGESIRVHGIDAPELKQRCADGWRAGEAAQKALAGLLAKGAAECLRVETDRYGRTVAICRVNGEDIAAAMVRRGLAWAYTTYSLSYIGEELRARFDRVGVHARSCDMPARWRAAHPH
jgi:endonuclease YncB( thermonuclease family)